MRNAQIYILSLFKIYDSWIKFANDPNTNFVIYYRSITVKLQFQKHSIRNILKQGDRKKTWQNFLENTTKFFQSFRSARGLNEKYFAKFFRITLFDTSFCYYTYSYTGPSHIPRSQLEHQYNQRHYFLVLDQCKFAYGLQFQNHKLHYMGNTQTIHSNHHLLNVKHGTSHSYIILILR